MKKILPVLIASAMMLFEACNFMNSFQEQPAPVATVTDIKLNKTAVSIMKDSFDYLTVTVTPTELQSKADVKWTYDNTILEVKANTKYGVTLRGLKEGQTVLTASCNGHEAVCIITITKNPLDTATVTTEPFIYSSDNILQMEKDTSRKVYVALDGGTAGDVSDFTWTSQNPAVAAINATGQYCVIDAKSNGYTTITVKHPKAQFPFYFGVYVYTEPGTEPFITTEDNIISLLSTDTKKEVTVKLANGKSGTESQFKWEIVKDESSEIPVTMDAANNRASFIPVKNGICKVKISHPDAVYPLELLCRVIKVEKNIYIQSDTDVMHIRKGMEQSFHVSLNVDDNITNPKLFTTKIEDEEVCELSYSVGKEFVLKGLKQGATKVVVSHEAAKYDKEILVIVDEETAQIDASCYITTDSNYIRIKENETDVKIDVYLKGGQQADAANFEYSVDNEEIISVQALKTSEENRMASNTYASGSLLINPKKLGTATITVKHPKVLYPTEILVKVIGKDSIQSEVLYFTGEGIIKMLNNTQTTYTAEIKGKNAEAINLADTVFKKQDTDKITLAPVSNKVVISSPAIGSGSTLSKITVSHPAVEYDKEILVLTADTQVELDAMKVLYADKQYYNLTAGETVDIPVNYVGFTLDEIKTITWTAENTGIIRIDNTSSLAQIRISGLKAGATKLTATLGNSTVTYNITVYPEGYVENDKSVYFTTSKNVVVLNPNETTELYALPVNLEAKEYPNIKWESENTSVATVIANGTKATITAHNIGEALLKVSHPASENVLKIYIRVGSEYANPGASGKDPYISSVDTIKMLVSDEDRVLNAYLMNTAENPDSFTFNIDKSEIAEIKSQTGSGTAVISSRSSGIAQITISHPSCRYPKKVIVIVANTQAELDAMCYMTVDNNIISILQGQNKEVTVKMHNSSGDQAQGTYTWSSSDPSVVHVASWSNNTAILKANKPGSAKITVTNSDCTYPVEFLVQCLSSTAETGGAGTNPYIQASDTIKMLMGAEPVVVNASVMNTAKNPNGFKFTIDRSDVAVITSQTGNGTALIAPAGPGTAQLTISHPDCEYDKTVLILVAKTQAELDEMIYLSTDNSVISIVEGKTRTVYVNLNGKADAANAGWSWVSSDPSVVQIDSTAGTTAILKGFAAGTAKITVTATVAGASYVLDMLVQCTAGGSLNQSGNNTINGEPYISANDIVRLTTDSQAIVFNAYLMNIASVTAKFTFDVDDTSVAKISKQTGNGTVYIEPVSAGQAQMTITHPDSKFDKKVLIVVNNAGEELTPVPYLTTDTNVVSIVEGGTRTVYVNVKNTSETVLDGFAWTSQNPAVVQVVSHAGTSAVLKANSLGTTKIIVSNTKCKYGIEIIAQCLDASLASDNPYIMLNASVITVNAGASGFTNVTAELVGGTEQDNSSFLWVSGDNSICTVYGQNEVGKLKALKEGQTYITVTHPKAPIPGRLLVVAEKKQETNCYIRVSQNIIHMKPTDGYTNITAQLVNGTEDDDVDFTWEVGPADIIELECTAGTATVKPKKAGTAQVTVKHKKSNSPQVIKVVVAQYTTFAFPTNSVSITQGETTFLNMQVPDSDSIMTVEYKTANEKICTVTGTGSVAQITGVGDGTTTVTANLKSGTTVQGTSELLVYVKKKDTSQNYLTSTSTINTLSKGKSITLSASLVGSEVNQSDNNDIKWTTTDTDKITLSGAGTDGSVKGNAVYVTANAAGSAIVTCSHAKAASNLLFHIIVPNDAAKDLSLSKTYVSMTKGTSGTELKAALTNSTASDYNSITWSVYTDKTKKTDGSKFVRIMGSGQSVVLYPLAKGTVYVFAKYGSSEACCEVNIAEANSFTASATSMKIRPEKTQEFTYTVTPADAIITWTTSQQAGVFSYSDVRKKDSDTGSNTGSGTVTVTGGSEGNGMLYGVTDGGAKISVTIQVANDYAFELSSSTRISKEPGKLINIPYYISPSDATVEVICDAAVTATPQNGSLTLKTTAPGEYNVIVNAKDGNKVFASREITIVSKYTSLTPSYTIEPSTKVGNFSSVIGDYIELGDGETIDLKLSYKETGITIQKITATVKDDYVSVFVPDSNKPDVIRFTHKQDFTKPQYKITKGKKIVNSVGSEVKSNNLVFKAKHQWWENGGAENGIDNYTHRKQFYYGLWDTSTDNLIYGWGFDCAFRNAFGDRGYAFVDFDIINEKLFKNDWKEVHKEWQSPKFLHSDKYKIVDNPSLDGTYVEVSDFEDNPLYFLPETYTYEDADYIKVTQVGKGIIQGVTKTVEAQLEPITTNTAVEKRSVIVNMTVTTNNGTEYFDILVNEAKRYCSKDLIVQ